MGDWRNVYILHMVVCLIVSVHMITSVIRNRKDFHTESSEPLKSEDAFPFPVFGSLGTMR